MSNKTPKILYCGGGVTVCVKPAGLSSEADMPALLSDETGAQALCVHRLDTAAGGVMVFAENRAAAGKLSAAIREGRMEKTYLCVCAGCPAPREGEMRDLLFRDARKNKSFVVSRMRKGVREAALHYRVLSARDAFALVSVRLETGRSHQIRAQFASRKHPLLGDGKYGSTVKNRSVALWSHALAFPLPATGERVSFACPPPRLWPWTMFEEIRYAELQTDSEL